VEGRRRRGHKDHLVRSHFVVVAIESASAGLRQFPQILADIRFQPAPPCKGRDELSLWFDNRRIVDNASAVHEAGLTDGSMIDVKENII